MKRFRAFAGILAAGLLALLATFEVQAATIPTRQIAPGVYGYAPNAGGVIVNIIGTALTRGAPWITAASIGVEIAKMVYQTSDGQIAVTTAGKALLDAVGITTTTPAAYEGPAWTPSYATSPLVFNADINTTATTMCGAAPRSISAIDYNNGYGNAYVSCWNSGLSSNVIQGYRCTPPAATNFQARNTPPTNCGTRSSTTNGGTEEWSPRAIQMPDGTTQWGWEAPSDPAISNPNNVTPSDYMDFPAVNGVQPQVTITPNPDGGYTVQSWSPEFNTATPPQQTGWTVQTMTVNNGGIVTSSSITINNQTGPPASKPPTTTAGNPFPQGTPTTPTSPTPVNIQCGSLNCEATQQSMLNELKGTAAGAAPDLSNPGVAAMAADKAKSDAAIGTIQSDGVAAVAHDNFGIWPNFAFTPPMGSCTPPTTTLARGVVITINYCTWVDNIKSFLGWMFAVFAAFHIWGLAVSARGYG